jgi:hypothetical protein
MDQLVAGRQTSEGGAFVTPALVWYNPAAGAVVIMPRTLKMHGMAQAVGELTEQGSPAFEAALHILETGNDSFRFKNSSAKAPKPEKEKPRNLTNA